MADCDAEALLFGDEQKNYKSAHNAFEKADSDLNGAALATWGDIATMWGAFSSGGGKGAIGFVGGAVKGIVDEGRFNDAAEVYNDAYDDLQDATNALSNAADILCDCLGEDDGEGHGGIPGVDYPIEDSDGNPVDNHGNPWAPW